jgi:predicted Zn-dependent peptidase
MKYFVSQLANGLTLLEVPDETSESVIVNCFVKTGSRSETPKENGIAHFLEHFLFKGTQKYPSPLAINELVDRVGGEMNAQTSKESTQYFIKASHGHLEMIMDILAEMLQRPLLDRSELAREKGVIMEEMNMYKDAPASRVQDILELAMWPNTSLGAEIIGTKPVVTAFTPAMFKSYLKRFYQPNNIIIGISGKYKRTHFRSLIEKLWADMPKASIKGWKKVTDTQIQPRVTVEKKQTEQAHIAIGFKSLDYNHPQNSALSVLSAILGGGMSSRLFMEVREKRGLAYYVRCAPYHYLDTGHFNVSAGVQVAQVEESVRVLAGELMRLKYELVEDAELAKAKEYIRGRTLLSLEDNVSRLDWYLEQVAFKDKVRTPDEALAKIATVTAADIQAVARIVCDFSKATLGIVGPFVSTKPFEKLLQGLYH